MHPSDILALVGGLGLFLFGMNVMSEGIEKVAGSRLRHILEIFTTNRFTGIIVGTVFTAIIQSSSACTAMVVSFVNSGLMNLYQAAGVIFGANIGTCVTALLVSFKLERIAPIILLAGVLMMMVGKNPTVKKVGEVITGFGTLFMGLSSMSSAMSGMKDSPEVLHMFSSLRNPFVATFLGFATTAVIQSSSVTVSIMVLLANQGLIKLNMILYIILGCNIGACTTAILASLSGRKEAKRAAMIHLLFNIIGTVILYVILWFANAPVANMLTALAKGNPGRSVAYAHLLIKIFQVIILTPFIGGIVKMTYVIIPGEDKKVGYRDSFQLKYIGDKVVFNPATAVVEVVKEIDRMASLASENLNRAMNALITLDQDDINEVYEVEKNINFLNHSITNYLVKINQAPLPIDDLKSIGALFHVVNDIERIGDHAENIADSAKRRIETGVSFSKPAQEELGNMMELVNEIIRYAVDIFVNGSEEHMDDVNRLEDQIDQMERQYQQSHIERLERNECSPEAGMMFSDILSALERVGDHATNIAFAVMNSENEAEHSEHSAHEEKAV
jgi:phosphate:Na+ symporter